MILPAFAVFFIGILMMFFIPYAFQEGSASRTSYAAISGLVMIFGYVSVPTVVNALVRQNIPEGEEGIFMGVRMLFVVALPMCIGPFIGDSLNRAFGSKVESSLFEGVFDTVPSQYGYLVGAAILLFALLPIYFYFRKEKQIHASE